MMILNRLKWRGKTWEEWEMCEGTPGLTLQECEGLIRGWSEEPGNRVVQVENTTKVYGPLNTEEYRIVEDGFDVARLNETIAASLAGMRK